jgi:NADH-dependent peroxiredoxin subunit C
MACDTGSKPIEENENIITEENENNEIKKEKNMSSSLVLRKAPEFKMAAYDSKTGHYTNVSSEDYKGKWHVVCFYPADFTFVCPTEIAAMNAKYDEFQELGVEILAVSTDTKFSHKRFVETEPLLAGLQLTGRFLINPEGTVVAQEVQAPMVGRNVHEFLRQVRAWQHAEKTGEVCPAGWVPGKKTLPVNTDVEQMTGRVGDYITIEEIMA